MRHSLAFRQDGTFTITQFTDIHWKDGGPADQRSRRLMEIVLDEERPDLVVFTGDVIYTGDVTPGRPICDNPEQALREAVHAAEIRNIPWAIAFGNHDTEKGISREALMEIVQSLPYSVAERGPKEVSGVGNYTLHIDDDKNSPAAVLYFFDSGNLSPVPRIQGYDWIRNDQVQWYMAASRKLRERNHGNALPSLAFFHIPLPEYREVWDTKVCYGNKFEEIGCPRVNSGLFASMVEMGDVMGTFTGHDHVNDYWGELHGIRLCYGRATGYNTYGRENFPRGARMIRLHQGQSDFETWLRLDDNTVIRNQPEHLPGV
ncbi:metallophosphoesterase family protein [Paenibacillus silviterrae]|uniref:metallophosphoesterase family protein n=1 Tax=Paenibacillus silviterrae TaxID=3242194 RepID=UPI002543E4F1|nr:metallophosphoesterase family protein [Paenibacillus chinjuensis]